jgi:hypothetical protein
MPDKNKSDMQERKKPKILCKTGKKEKAGMRRKSRRKLGYYVRVRESWDMMQEWKKQ